MSTKSRIGLNIQAQALRDHDRLMNHIRKTQPAAVLVMDGLGLAQEIKGVSPDSIVIHRNYMVTAGDDDVWARVDPVKWLDIRGKEADTGVWLYTTNEPGWGADVLQWHVKLMELCVLRKIRLVVGGWSVGTPEPERWPMAKDLLQLCAEYPDLFILNLHEYGAGVLTSGLVGGAPDDPRHANYIYPAHWPEKVDVTRFHCGRFKFALDYCKLAGIKPPRIIITEHGMDDVSDIKAWLNTLKRGKDYQNITGWRSLKDQWAVWYPAWSHDRAYFEQLRWADQAIYQGSPVEAQLIYCWGHTSDRWIPFDIEDATELQSYLEQYANEQTKQPPPPPPEVKPLPAMPKPSNATAQHRFMATLEHELLEGPGSGYKLVGKVLPGDEAVIYDVPPVFMLGKYYKWADVKTGALKSAGGWVVDENGWKKLDTAPETKTVTSDYPVVKPEPAETPLPYRMQIITYKTVSLPPSAAKALMDAGMILELVSS